MCHRKCSEECPFLQVNARLMDGFDIFSPVHVPWHVVLSLELGCILHLLEGVHISMSTASQLREISLMFALGSNFILPSNFHTDLRAFCQPSFLDGLKAMFCAK